jgi:biopolymer transport protein ExbD
MRNRRRVDEESFEIPLTPLVDIIFILIVFFLVATTFYSEERDLKIQLPEGTAGDLLTPDSEPYIINLRASGVIVVRNRIIGMDELGKELQALVRKGRKKVEIRGDADCRHRHVMGVMNLCKERGVTDYSLTQRILTEAP